MVRRFPMIAGIDFAGTVEQSSHPQWKTGDKVICTGWGMGETHLGAYAEKARVKGDWLVRLPRRNVGARRDGDRHRRFYRDARGARAGKAWPPRARAHCRHRRRGRGRVGCNRSAVEARLSRHRFHRPHVGDRLSPGYRRGCRAPYPGPPSTLRVVVELQHLVPTNRAASHRGGAGGACPASIRRAGCDAHHSRSRPGGRRGSPCRRPHRRPLHPPGGAGARRARSWSATSPRAARPTGCAGSPTGTPGLFYPAGTAVRHPRRPLAAERPDSWRRTPRRRRPRGPPSKVRNVALVGHAGVGQDHPGRGPARRHRSAAPGRPGRGRHDLPGHRGGRGPPAALGVPRRGHRRARRPPDHPAGHPGLAGLRR